MIKTEAFQEFKQGITRMRDNDHEQALVHMHRAVELESHNPYYISYLGVLRARAGHNWADAQQLCQTALQLKNNEPQLYLNLAEVYASAGRREDAAETLVKGLRYARRDLRLQLALNKLSIRRRPVLSFLGRKHFLNRSLGKLRHRALQYLGDKRPS